MSTGSVIGAGITAFQAVSGKAKTEHPSITRSVFYDYAEQTAERISNDTKRAKLEDIRTSRGKKDLVDGMPLAIPAGVGEVFGYRLSKHAGVRVPETLLQPTEPTDEDLRRYYIKRVAGGYVLSERIKASLPVYFLSDKCKTLPGFVTEGLFRKAFLSLYDKRCPLERSAYADFPYLVPEVALDAARWDSEQRLRQYAYRAFLHCTYPHTSNALVDIEGNLWLIDFEKMVLSEGDDIDLLYRLIKDSASAINICAQMCVITPEAIHQSLADIPAAFWTVQKSQRGLCDTPEKAAAYFVDRLQRWKEIFKGEN